MDTISFEVALVLKLNDNVHSMEYEFTNSKCAINYASNWSDAADKAVAKVRRVAPTGDVQLKHVKEWGGL